VEFPDPGQRLAIGKAGRERNWATAARRQVSEEALVFPKMTTINDKKDIKDKA